MVADKMVVDKMVYSGQNGTDKIVADKMSRTKW